MDGSIGISSPVRGIAWFLFLAFVPAWAMWFGAWFLGFPLDNPIVQLITAAFLPAAAAFVVRRWITREGFGDCGLRPRLRSAWRWYLLAVAIPPGMLLIAVPAGLITGTARLPPGGLSNYALVLAAPLVVILAAPIFFGEEFGWTAYLRGRLGQLGPLRGRPQLAAAVTGAIWGAWHWPLALVGYFSYQPPLRDILATLVLWVVMSVLLEIVWSWLWYGSGTLWTTTLAHGGFNLVFSATLANFIGLRALITGFVLPSLALLPIVLIILWRNARRPAIPIGTPAFPAVTNLRAVRSD